MFEVNGVDYTSLNDFAKRNLPPYVAEDTFYNRLRRDLGRRQIAAANEALYSQHLNEQLKKYSKAIIVKGKQFTSLTEACLHFAPRNVDFNKYYERVRCRLRSLKKQHLLTQANIDNAFIEKPQRILTEVVYKGKYYRSLGHLFESYGYCRQNALRQYKKHHDGSPTFLERFMNREIIWSCRERITLSEELKGVVDNLTVSIIKSAMEISPNMQEANTRIPRMFDNTITYRPSKLCPTLNSDHVHHIARRFGEMFGTAYSNTTSARHVGVFKQIITNTLLQYIK